MTNNSTFSWLSSLALLATSSLVACGTPDRPGWAGPPDDDGAGGHTASGTGGAGLGGEGPSSGGSGTPLGGQGGEGAEGENDPLTGILCGETKCSVFATCDDTDDGATCVCAEGFMGDGQRCSDVDECADDESICGESAYCVNLKGDYECVCDAGFVWDGEECVDMDECAADPCDAGASCTNEDAGFSCSCDSGFGDGTFCNDADECAGDPCGNEGTCVQLPDAFACQCDLGWEGQTSCTSCGDALTITDPGLIVAVNLQLGRAFDDESEILLSGLETETSLDAYDFNVRDLSGLECWTSLRFVDLEANEGLVSGAPVEALSKLTNLQELNLNCTGVTDVDALASHPTLQALTLSAANCGSQLDDPAALGTLPEIVSLNLIGQGLNGLTFLEDVSSLRWLFVDSNALTDFLGLESMSLLNHLSIAQNALSDLEGVSNLSALRSLNIADNQITRLDELTSLTQLTTLNALGNRLTVLPRMDAMITLSQVDLSFNELTTLSEVANWSQVKSVNVGANAITTLDPLLDGIFDGTLQVTGNPLNCETETENFVVLRGQGMNIVGTCEGD